MNFLPDNLKYLRQSQQMTQQDLADVLNLKRSLIGAYEEGRATPKILVIQQIAAHFNLTLDQFISSDLKAVGVGANGPVEKDLRVLSIVVDAQNNELIPIIPIKASAGYLNGFADPEYLGQLAAFNMPVPELSPGKTFRVFQIKGDSMLPVQPGSYVFCEFVETISAIKEGQTYVLITKDEGLVYKRVFLQGNRELRLQSDNSVYEPYTIDVETVLELWKADGVLSFNLPQPNHLEISRLSDILTEMKEEIRQLRKE
ncbi:XRE family transcriptional regulator [Mangrovibacterium lignilyticum]|uniref:XRE family transcriptional regulator n=1 Tax=Mangrovibacterium lignilyticum TaxID=2668052 RepID=UPI0013D66D5F|nr:LexA family transcriptional regulator [Mangrovibacterium lignilyticum]